MLEKSEMETLDEIPCRELERVIVYLEGGMDDDTRYNFEGHLFNCKECLEEAARLIQERPLGVP